MTMHIPRQRIRGILSARADAADATKILADLQKTFSEFRAERDKELADIKAKLGDVVQTEKVDRINAEITNLTKALDDINAAIAASKLGAGNDNPGDSADAKAHRKAFQNWFRTGQAGNLGDLEVKASLTSQSKPDGGYVTPNTLEARINRVLGTMSALRGLSGNIAIGTQTYSKFVNMGGAVSAWVGEEDSRTETGTPTLRELIFAVMEQYAEPYTTQVLLDDAAIDIEAWLADEVSITFADGEAAAFVNGNGVKRPRGLLSYDTVANASYAWGKLGFVVTGGAAAFAASNPADVFVDAYYALKSGYRANAAWLMNDAVMGAVRKQKDGQGNYLWAPPTVAGEVPTILGKPVHTDDNMPALGANAFPVAIGDFRQGYLVIDRMGIRVLRNPYKVNGKVAFYTTKRVGGGVQNFEAIKLIKCST